MTRFSKLILFLLLAGSLAAQQNVQYSYDAGRPIDLGELWQRHGDHLHV